MRQILLIPIYALLVWLPIPLGSNRPEFLYLAELLILLQAMLCVLAWSLGAVRFQGSLRVWGYCALIWGLWLSWVAMQWFDLPHHWVNGWSPQRVAQSKGLAMLNDVPFADMTISVAAQVTFQHWLESLAYAALFMSTLFLAGGNRWALRQLCWVLVFSGLLQVGYGAVMLLTGLEQHPFGEKYAYIGSATGTFINRNHFAGYLELCFAAGVGLTLLYSTTGREAGSWRSFLENLRQTGTKGYIARLAVCILIIGLLLSQSRMGNAAAFGGLLTAGLLYVLMRRRKDWSRMLLFLAGLLIVDLWLVGDIFGLDQLVERYEKTDLRTTQRVSFYPSLEDLRKTYFPTGSGLGTFELVYPEFHRSYTKGRPRHAHNDYYQFMIESGIPGILCLGLLVLPTVWHCLLVLRRRKDATYNAVGFAGLMAITAIALHSMTDFNLQIPSNAATMVVFLAMCWSCNAKRRKLRSKPVKAVD